MLCCVCLIKSRNNTFDLFAAFLCSKFTFVMNVSFCLKSLNIESEQIKIESKNKYIWKKIRNVIRNNSN